MVVGGFDFRLVLSLAVLVESVHQGASHSDQQGVHQGKPLKLGCPQALEEGVQDSLTTATR